MDPPLKRICSKHPFGLPAIVDLCLLRKKPCSIFLTCFQRRHLPENWQKHSRIPFDHIFRRKFTVKWQEMMYFMTMIKNWYILWQWLTVAFKFQLNLKFIAYLNYLLYLMRWKSLETLKNVNFHKFVTLNLRPENTLWKNINLTIWQLQVFSDSISTLCVVVVGSRSTRSR